MAQLPSEWQAFFAELGAGNAAFGLFELGERGEQPVLLIHASPDMSIPRGPALRSIFEGYIRDGIYIVRLLVEMADNVPFAPVHEELTVTLYDHEPYRRPLMQITNENTRPLLRFETFLNPAGQEDRLILKKLALISALSVSMVKAGEQLWGQEFPWQEPLQQAVQQILELTDGITAPTPEAWQAAKEQIVSEVPLFSNAPSNPLHQAWHQSWEEARRRTIELEDGWSIYGNL